MILKEFTIYKGVPFNSSYSDVLDFGEYTPESESAGKDYIKNFLDNNYEKKVYSRINKGVNIYGLNCKININMEVDDYYQYNYICAKFVNKVSSATKDVLYFYFIDKIDVINSANSIFTCSLSLVKDCWTNNLYNIYFGDYDKTSQIKRRHKNVFYPHGSLDEFVINSRYKASLSSINIPSNSSLCTIPNEYEIVVNEITLDNTKEYFLYDNDNNIITTVFNQDSFSSSKKYVYEIIGVRKKGDIDLVESTKNQVLAYRDANNTLDWSYTYHYEDKTFSPYSPETYSNSEYFLNVNKTTFSPLYIVGGTGEDENNIYYYIGKNRLTNKAPTKPGTLKDSNGNILLRYCLVCDTEVHCKTYFNEIIKYSDNWYVNGYSLEDKLNPVFHKISEIDDVIDEFGLFKYKDYIPETYFYPFKYISVKTMLEDVEFKPKFNNFDIEIKKYFLRDGVSYSYSFSENGKEMISHESTIKSSFHKTSFPISTEQYKAFVESSFNSFNAQYTNQVFSNTMSQIMTVLGFTLLALIDPTKLSAPLAVGAIGSIVAGGVKNANIENTVNSYIEDLKNKPSSQKYSSLSSTNDLFFMDGIYLFYNEVTNFDTYDVQNYLLSIYYYGTEVNEFGDISNTFQNNFDFIQTVNCDIPIIKSNEERKMCEYIFDKGVIRWHIDGYNKAIKTCNKDYANFNRIIIEKGA